MPRSDATIGSVKVFVGIVLVILVVAFCATLMDRPSVYRSTEKSECVDLVELVSEADAGVRGYEINLWDGPAKRRVLDRAYPGSVGRVLSRSGDQIQIDVKGAIGWISETQVSRHFRECDDRSAARRVGRPSAVIECVDGTLYTGNGRACVGHGGPK